MKRPAALLLFAFTLFFASCNREEPNPTGDSPAGNERVSILLVTMDTTRADAIGPATPSFNALAARGRRYAQAYAPVPQTLPAHASMMTGLYPGGHGVRENGRFLEPTHPLLAERLKERGYRTAAFISAFALARRFGLGRGFDVYDEDFGKDGAERDAKKTTDRALSWLSASAAQPAFLWVHYYDPHYPYAPPEPFKSAHAAQPYAGEVAFMDEQIGRLAREFERRAPGRHAMILVADHGEGLGEHGEQQHGNLLYQSTMHVPMVLVAPGVAPGTSAAPVSTRRIFHTVLDLAGMDATQSLRGNEVEPVIAGEAMKPFLDYGWQPQVMAVEGRMKTIHARQVETYDVIADPRETRNLGPQAEMSRAVRATLRDYPLPVQGVAAAETPATEEDRKKLASLGYVASTARPVIRHDAPRPIEMVKLFPILDEAASLFVNERYAAAIPLLRQILEADPHNLDAALRLATAHSTLGQDAPALEGFARAQAIAPDSADVRTYLALHLAKGDQWERAVPMLERIVTETPNKVPALEALALVRERQGRLEDAVAVRQKLYALRAPNAAELVATGNLAMQTGQTAIAIESFERARAAQGAQFRSHLELGVLYLAANRLTEARDSLDRVSQSHPAYPMALFKRAQVSVLLRESDASTRIAAARERADAVTRPLIERERLFQQ